MRDETSMKEKGRKNGNEGKAEETREWRRTMRGETETKEDERRWEMKEEKERRERKREKINTWSSYAWEIDFLLRRHEYVTFIPARNALCWVTAEKSVFFNSSEFCAYETLLIPVICYCCPIKSWNQLYIRLDFCCHWFRYSSGYLLVADLSLLPILFTCSRFLSPECSSLYPWDTVSAQPEACWFGCMINGACWTAARHAE